METITDVLLGGRCGHISIISTPLGTVAFVSLPGPLGLSTSPPVGPISMLSREREREAQLYALYANRLLNKIVL